MPSIEGMGAVAGSAYYNARQYGDKILSNKYAKSPITRWGAGIGAMGMGGYMMGSSYGRHGGLANAYTGLGTIGAGVAGYRMGGWKGAALGAFLGDRSTRFQENHPVLGFGAAGLVGGGALGMMYSSRFRSAATPWLNKGAGLFNRAAKGFASGFARGALRGMRMV